MPTKLDIANSALNKIGSPPILSLEDASKEARTCKLRIDLVKDIVLRSHPWNCATRRVVLSPLTSTPVFGNSYEYQLPSDCLRVVECSDSEYSIEGKKLVCDDASLDVRIIFSQDYPNIDPMLAEVIAEYLAWDICYAITQSMGLKDEKWKDYEKALRKAKTVDGQEEPPKEIEANLFLEARLGGDNARLPMRNWPSGGYPT
jgi:hypothetical protein